MGRFDRKLNPKGNVGSFIGMADEKSVDGIREKLVNHHKWIRADPSIL